MRFELAFGYFIQLLKAAGQGTALGGKYLSRKWTGKRWQYEYKPVSQRGAHELTKDRFEKVTKISDSTHKESIEKALQNGQRVNVRILRDYPDLIKKYGQEKRIEKADRINKKVKELLGRSDAPKMEQKGYDFKEINLVGSEKQQTYAKDLLNRYSRFVNNHNLYKTEVLWERGKKQNPKKFEDSKIASAESAMSRLNDYLGSINEGHQAADIIAKLTPMNALQEFYNDGSDLQFRIMG